MNKIKISTLVLSILYFSMSYGQDNNDLASAKTKKYAKYLDLRVENGAMLGTSADINDQLVNSSYYNGIDLRVGFRKTDPNDVYSTIYRRPYMGFGVYTSTFHNSDVGRPNALYYFLTFPFKFEQNKRFTFDYSMAFGLSSQFNPYDKINNPTNIFIGSYRNCYVHLGVAGNYKISDRWIASATLGFKHFSNGSFKQPNYGINLVPLTIGVSYKFTDQEIDHFAKQIPSFQKYNIWNVSVAVGSKNYAHDEPNYLKMTYGLNFLRAINYKYRIGLGLDVFYSAKSGLRTESGKADFFDAVSFALVPNWEWVLSKKLYVPLGIGLYLNHNEQNDERVGFYERAGIRYKFTDHLAAGITIKAHKGTADFFEWALVYSFQNDKNKY